jgi:RNA polymerase sigma-70 factor (ECF subfamily)
MTEGIVDTLTSEDSVLVSACRKGDVDAFEKLVNKYKGRVFSLAFRVLGNYEDATEVAQDAFVAAWRGLGGFRGTAAFSTWLTTITVNQARNRLKQTRMRRQREPYSLDEPVQLCDGCVDSDPPSDGPSAHDQLEREEVRERVQGCINGLEPGFREVLVLRDVEGFSYGEIGTMLRMNDGTVKSRLSRAREAIRDCLKKVVGDF